MATFIGRTEELSRLKSVFDCNIRNCYINTTPRMGASALVKKFCESRKSITITFPESTRRMCIQVFANAVQNYSRETISSETFQDLFQDLKRAVKGTDTVIIFERTHFAPEDFPPALKEFSDNNDLMIVLIGQGDSDRYDITFSEIIDLGELPMQECRRIHQKMNPLDSLKTYMVAGGRPAYHMMLNKSDFNESIEKGFLSNYSKLGAECENLLRRSNVPYGICCAILWDIANCMGRPVDIANAEGISRQLCDIYLKKLTEEGLVRTLTPMGNAPKKPFYVIDNPLIAFYFIAIKSNQMVRAEEKLELKTILPSIDLFMELRFRDICEEYLKTHYKCIRVGRWWSKDENTSKPTLVAIIDVQGTEKTIVADCKFRFNKMDADALKNHIARSALVLDTPEKSLMMFSISGFDDKLVKKARAENVVLVGPDELL